MAMDIADLKVKNAIKSITLVIAMESMFTYAPEVVITKIAVALQLAAASTAEPPVT